MKRIFAIILFVFISTTNSFATFFIDGLGTYVNAGDMENQLGGGLGFGIDINRNLNFLFRAANTSTIKNQDKIDEVEFRHTTYMGGIEVIPELPALQKYRLSWKTSILAGVSSSKAELKNSYYGKDADEAGFACSFWTGIQYDLTQVVSPFIDLGYHSSFYTDKLKDESIQGYQIAIGIRFYLTGNRDYAGDYQ